MKSIFNLISISLAFIMSTSSAFTGQGTFYGGAGQAGACMLPVGFNDVAMTVAVNPFQWEDGMSCGKCVVVYGTGKGLGMTPIFGPIFATIDNLCPECKDGDIDFGMEGDGRWDITWDFIDCGEAREGLSNIPVWDDSVTSHPSGGRLRGALSKFDRT